jgi:murein biosynthesis integral membrane protein MurJ
VVGSVEQAERRYLFTGGGTGGHVTPNLAILTELRFREPKARFLYLGSARGYEVHVREGGIPFSAVPCAPLCSPRHPLRAARMVWRILLGILVAGFHIVRYRPHVVIASGGYVSVPTVVAAFLLRRRIYVHEQNVHPGRANRFLALLATRVGVTFRETLDVFPKGKTVLAGYPVRQQICEGSSERARERFHIPVGHKVAFIVGGSMGSRAINRGTVEALRSLLRRDDVTVIHSTGLSKGEYPAYQDTCDRLQRAGLADRVSGRYICKPFFKNIQDIYAVADLVVARAGAGTIMELAAVGKPCLLVPKSDVPGDHQLLNAMSFQSTGSAEVLLEERGEEGGRPITRIRGDTLAKKINDLLSDNDHLTRMGEMAKKVAVTDALRVHGDLVARLAKDDAVTDTIRETDRVGFLEGKKGSSHELLFRSNIVGTGLLADVRIKPDDNTSRARAIILRSRQGGTSEFTLVRRAGAVLVGGNPVRGRVLLTSGDRIDIGGQAFDFVTRDEEVDRPANTGGMGLRVLVTSLGTLASRISGFVRDAVMAAAFGLGNTMDLMTVGLMVSNYFRGVFAEQATDTAFLPTYLHLQRTGRTERANRLFSAVLTLTVVASGAVTLLAVLTLPMWLPLLVPGYVTRGIIDEAVSLTRLMFPYLVLISAAAVLSAVLKACNRFAVPAFSSVMLNAGILMGVALYPWLGLNALGIGLLLGGVGQVAIQIPALLSRDVRQTYGVRFRPQFGLRDEGVRKVGRVTPNILTDVSVQKAGSMVDTIIATSLAPGMVSALWFAMRLFSLPFGLISQSINTVILKELSEHQALKDKDWSRRLLAGGVNWTCFTLLPVSATLIVLAEPLVRLVFGFGEFDREAVDRVSLALRCYAVGLVGWGLTGLCGRFFSARMEQSRSTATSILALGINIAVSLTLVSLGFGIAGLAIGTSVAFLVCAALRLALLNSAMKSEGTGMQAKDIWPSLWQTSVATAGALAAMMVAHEAVRSFDALPQILDRLFVLLVPLGFGALAFLAAAFLIRSEQVEEILFKLGRRGRRTPREPAGPRPINPYCIDPPSRLLAWVSKHPDAAQSYNFARRVTTFLNNRDWKVRNVGVKLVGKLKLSAFRDDLAEIVSCREPAPLSVRLLGGDFVQPGFLRRNAITALEALRNPDPRSHRALLLALDDPYYEVRVEGARVLGVFAERLGGACREEATARLIRLVKDRNFEVAAAATDALGSVAQDDTVVEVLRSLHYHRNWKVRDCVVGAYRRLFERSVVKDPRRLLALLDDVLTTSEGFIPRFVLKEHMTELQKRLLQGTRAEPGAAQPEAPREQEAAS